MSSPALSQRFAFFLGWVADVWKAWRHFWFAPADPAVISLIRLLTGGMLLYNLAVWSIDLEAFFSSKGLQPTSAFAELTAQQWSFSFWRWVDDAWLWHAHIASLVIVFLFFIGAGTRVTSVLAFLITISYSQRVPIANFGLDQILGILCLYLLIAPCGAAFSVDAVLRRRWLKRKQTFPHRRGHAATRVLQAPSARLAMRLIQIHLCMIYLWAGLAKLKGTVWWTGEAIWRVVANAEYQTADLTWLAWFPWIPQTLSILTVAWELSFCILIWNRRLRPLVLGIGTAMHLGIGAFLGMWTFGLIMCVAYLAFLPPSWPGIAMSRCNHSIHRLRRIMSANAAVADVTKNVADVDCELTVPGKEATVTAESSRISPADFEGSPALEAGPPEQTTLNKAFSMTDSPDNKTPFDDTPDDDFLLDALGFDDDDDAGDDEGDSATESETALEADTDETAETVDEFVLDPDDETEAEFDVMAVLGSDDEAEDATQADSELPAADTADELDPADKAEDVEESEEAPVTVADADEEGVEEPEPAVAAPSAAEESADQKGCILLFASKDKDRASLQTYFESRDFTCFSVSKLSGMVEAVGRINPDVILLLGRKVDGVVLADTVQKLHDLNKAPVAAVVSPEQRGHILTKTMPGTVDLASYPVSHRNLRYLVSGILSRHSQTDS